MTGQVTYTRYYFPNGLRWTLAVLLMPLSAYLIIIGWHITAAFCIVIVFALWTFKYVTTIDPKRRIIKDQFFRMAIPFGKTLHYNRLHGLTVTRETKQYKAATRSRDYWVTYKEYSLHLKYDEGNSLLLFTINDPDVFDGHVKRFSQELDLRVDKE